MTHIFDYCNLYLEATQSLENTLIIFRLDRNVLACITVVIEMFYNNKSIQQNVFNDVNKISVYVKSLKHTFAPYF